PARDAPQDPPGAPLPARLVARAVPLPPRPPPPAGPHAHLGPPVAGQVGRGHRDPAPELRVVGEEVGDRVAVRAVEHPDPWAAAGPGRGDHVRDPVGVHVGGGHVDPAGEGRLVRPEAGPPPGGLVRASPPRPRRPPPGPAPATPRGTPARGKWAAPPRPPPVNDGSKAVSEKFRLPVIAS